MIEALRPSTIERQSDAALQEKRARPFNGFSENVRDIVLLPIRGELEDGNLASYLHCLNRQRLSGRDKIGLILLVNHLSHDETNESLLAENTKIKRYITAISEKNPDEIDGLNLSDEYKTLAYDLMVRNQIEVVCNTFPDTPAETHFGNLDLESLRLANQYRNPKVDPDDLIIHFTGADILYSNKVFQEERKHYNNPLNRTNKKAYDILPATFEGKDPQDIGRKTLMLFDEYRLYQYGLDVQQGMMLAGGFGTPTLSARFSALYRDGYLHPTLQHMLSNQAMNDDFILSFFLSTIDTQNKPREVTGEVFWLHRTRPLRSSYPRTEAEYITKVISEMQFKGHVLDQPYNLLSEEERIKYIEALEDQVASIHNGRSLSAGHTSNYRERHPYQTILATERRHEQSKVRLRRIRLKNYIKSVRTGIPLDRANQRLIDPYIQYFPKEISSIKEALGAGQTIEQVAQAIMQQHQAFFDPEAEIHDNIAHLRTLKKYIISYYISVLNSFRSP